MKKLIILLLLLTSNFAYADDIQAQQQPPIYQVDIVAFKDIKGLQNLPANQWRPYQAPDFENAQNLEQQSIMAPIEQNQTELYTPLPESQFILSPDVAHIKRSSLYNFITQQSWLQQALEPAQTQTVLITAGQNYSEDNDSPVWELAGTVRVTSSLYQYLNLNVNFYLTEPGTDAAENMPNSDVSSEYPGLQMVQMQETRRIKVNQLNYIDSPGFGLLVKVVKISDTQNNTMT